MLFVLYGQDTVRARIEAISQLTPTVKALSITPISPITFRAGQWLDCFFPNVSTIGGFSIVNAPEEYAKSGKLELAVKQSTHPPALWVRRAPHALPPLHTAHLQLSVSCRVLGPH